MLPSEHRHTCEWTHSITKPSQLHKECMKYIIYTYSVAATLWFTLWPPFHTFCWSDGPLTFVQHPLCGWMMDIDVSISIFMKLRGVEDQRHIGSSLLWATLLMNCNMMDWYSQINNVKFISNIHCIITRVRPSGGGAYFQSSDRWAMGISHLLHYNLHSAQCSVQCTMHIQCTMHLLCTKHLPCTMHIQCTVQCDPGLA